MQRAPTIISGVLVLLFTIGCATPKPVTISCDPGGADVFIDGVPTGPAPLNHTFDFAQKANYHVEVKKAGYFDTQVNLTAEHPGIDQGLVQLALVEDESWTATAESRATNTWLRVEVNPALNPTKVWQIIIDAATTRFSSLEQLDAASGYCRTSPEQRSFQHSKHGQITIRTQLVSAIASTQPLVYKFKIISELNTSNQNRWSPYERVFKDDAMLIDELINRLSTR